MLSLVIIQITHDISKFLAGAVVAMPLFLLAMNHIARKKNEQAAADSLPLLVRVLRALWIAGPISVLAAFALIPARLAAHGYPWQMPDLTHPALMPYTAAISFWICAFILIHLLSRSIGTQGMLIPLFGLAILLFGQCTVLLWPFAGLPEGLTWSDAVVAVLRQAEHEYFHTLFPLGLTLLALLYGKNIPASIQYKKTPARKLLSATAAIGVFPETISNLGTLAGYLLRSQPLPPPLVLSGIHTVTTLAILLTLCGIFFAQKEKPFLFRLVSGLVLADILLPTLQILCA